MIGQKLGHFRIIDEIGSGGMGIVYRAEDEQLSRDVAIKVMKGGIFSDDAARKNFKKEAVTLSKLNHANIETVHEFSTQDGIDYLVMEFIPGTTLSEEIAKGPLSEKEILSLGAQLADGLATAHERHILHRDLKPANIRVTPEGRLKILDFGLAKLMPSSIETASTESAPGNKTAPGTLPYMAPEQLRAEKLDERTDIYGAGAILYEMATGRRPFPETQAALLIDSILHQEPELPSSMNRKISAGLDAVILKALDKEPSRRYQSARELYVDLQRLITPASASRTANVRVPVHKRKRFLFGAILGLVLVAIAWWQFGDSIRNLFLPKTLPRAKHLVVLPFTNVGEDPENQAFCDGLVEMVASKLSQLVQFHGTLLVVPTSEVRVEQVAGVREANKAFGVTLAINGSVQRWEGQIRITTNLIDARTLRQLDAVTVEAGLDDPFFHERLVQGIVNMLQLELGQNAKNVLSAGTTQTGKAYHLYLQGEGYLQHYEKSENLDAAIGAFKQAVELDNRFALGYAGLAKAYWIKYDITKDRSWVEQARQNCELAILLNENLAPVHVTWGVIQNGTGQYESAVQHFASALELDPANFEAYLGMAQAYQAIGQLEKAEATHQRAIQLQPDNWRTYMSLGSFYRYTGRYQDAAAMFQKVIRLVPDSFPGYISLAGVYLYVGKYPEAIEALQKSINIRPSSKAYWNLGYAYFMHRQFSKAASMYQNSANLGEGEHYAVWGNMGDSYYWMQQEDKGKNILRPPHRPAYERAISLAKQELEINPRNANALVCLAWYYAKTGNKAESLKALNQAIAFNQPDDPEFPFFAALVYNHFQDRDIALDWLERAIQRGYPKAELQRIEFDNLRQEPRFRGLTR